MPCTCDPNGTKHRPSARLAYVVVVHPSVPAKTIPEFIAYAKANPGKINYGSAGPGTPQNIACELFKMMAGVDLVHVPYRGGAPATPIWSPAICMRFSVRSQNRSSRSRPASCAPLR